MPAEYFAVVEGEKIHLICREGQIISLGVFGAQDLVDELQKFIGDEKPSRVARNQPIKEEEKSEAICPYCGHSPCRFDTPECRAARRVG